MRGVSQQAVNEFDMAYKGAFKGAFKGACEPGDDAASPYRTEP
jgi:hypothetical protein